MQEKLSHEICDLIVEQCGVPISLIQRRYRMQYSAVQALMDQLAENGLVSPAQESGLRMPAGELVDRILAVPGPAWSPMRRYVRRLYQLAWYAHENLEEGHSSDTRAIELLNPVSQLPAMEVRAFIEGGLKQGAQPIDAAHSLHEWLRENERIEAPALLWPVLQREFARVSRPAQAVRDRPQMIERAFVRAARYIREMREENRVDAESSVHSRIFEHFIPKAFVPIGRANGLVGQGHKEHVVPCAYLRDQAHRYIEAGWTDAQVGRFLQRCLAIVEIPVQAQQRLDRSDQLNLKSTMPPDWDPQTDDVFARLRLANVPFSML